MKLLKKLGLLDRVMQDGWKSLTSKETGKNRRSDHEKEASELAIMKKNDKKYYRMLN